jgi:hypothetical protein
MYLTVGWYLHLVARYELKLLSLFLAGVIVIGLTTTLLMAGWYAIERLRMCRANRIALEKQAHVLTVTSGQQVFIRDTDRKAYWRAAHLDTRTWVNGQQRDSTQTEIMTWQMFNAPRQVSPAQAALLPQTGQIELLPALDTVQRCLLVGASDTGKTTLLQWIISRRLGTSKVVVIDPHSWPGKWPEGCVVVGTGRKFADIERTLTALVQLMTKRYDEIGRGVVAEMAHGKITIVIDEWRAIVQNVKGASEAIKALLTESRKAAFSVFVATHSERVKALGIEGEGDLKDGFAVVRLLNINGQRQATMDTGNGEVPVVLPGQFSSYQSQVIEGQADDLDLELVPSPIEARIVELHHAGENVSTIATEVFGSKGGNQNDRVKEVLSKFGMV